MRSQFILFGFLRVVSCVGISSGTTSSVVTTPVYISTSLYTSQSSSNSAFSFLNASFISTSATSSFTSQVSSLTIPSTSHSSAFSSSSGYGFTSEYSVITSLSSHGSSFISPTLTTLDTSTTSSSECPSATSTGIDALTDDDFSPELLQAINSWNSILSNPDLVPLGDIIFQILELTQENQEPPTKRSPKHHKHTTSPPPVTPVVTPQPVLICPPIPPGPFQELLGNLGGSGNDRRVTIAPWIPPSGGIGGQLQFHF